MLLMTTLSGVSCLLERMVNTQQPVLMAAINSLGKSHRFLDLFGNHIPPTRPVRTYPILKSFDKASDRSPTLMIIIMVMLIKW